MLISRNLPGQPHYSSGISTPNVQDLYTASSSVAPSDRAIELRVLAGFAGLAAAMAVRVAVAGSAGVRSVTAGLVFGVFVAALAAATASTATPIRTDRWAVAKLVGLGLLGGVVLCIPALVRHFVQGGAALPLSGYGPWAIGVAVVAVAEESLLRGSLFAALDRRYGPVCAISVTSVAFGLLHAPLYGWAVVPLDIAVGCWLGALRASTGSVTVPAVAHTLADLAGWWLL